MKKSHYHFGVDLILEIIGGKWKPSIICSLDVKPKRYNALRKYLTEINGREISQKVLTEQLKQLEADLIVKRTEYDTVPPKVVYSLTSYGLQIHDFLIQMSRLGEELAPHLTDATHPIQFSYSYRSMIHHPRPAALSWSDGKIRCSWANPQNESYIQYHDQEWGRPVHDDQKLFELLILETFQAGLSWEIVLNKRQAFRKAFAEFDVVKVAQFNEADYQRLLNDTGIIRNRLKIKAAINNARVFQKIQQEWQSFEHYLWHWTNNQVIMETGLTHSKLSDQISQDLKRRGMKFVGSTTIYAYLQAIGVINGHQPACFLFKS